MFRCYCCHCSHRCRQRSYAPAPLTGTDAEKLGANDPLRFIDIGEYETVHGHLPAPRRCVPAGLLRFCRSCAPGSASPAALDSTAGRTNRDVHGRGRGLIRFATPWGRWRSRARKASGTPSSSSMWSGRRCFSIKSLIRPADMTPCARASPASAATTCSSLSLSDGCSRPSCRALPDSARRSPSSPRSSSPSACGRSTRSPSRSSRICGRSSSARSGLAGSRRWRWSISPIRAATAFQSGLLLIIPCLLGGFTVVWMYGRWQAIRHAWPLVLIIAALQGGGQALFALVDPVLCTFVGGTAALVALYPLSRWRRYAEPPQGITERPAMREKGGKRRRSPGPDGARHVVLSLCGPQPRGARRPRDRAGQQCARRLQHRDAVPGGDNRVRRRQCRRRSRIRLSRP